jgi:hypothetical protein
MPITRIKSIFTLFLLVSTCLASLAQAPDTVAGIPVNYDESKVGAYILPDPLRQKDGKKVTDADGWLNERRPEILEMFKENQYGSAGSLVFGLWTPDVRFQMPDAKSLIFNGELKFRPAKHRLINH